MGNDYQIATERSRANEVAANKQQTNAADAATPGKQTLASGLPPASVDADALLRSLKTRTIRDKAGFVFAITDEPAFELVHAPNGKGEGTIFRRTSPAWPTLVGLAMQLQPTAQQAPSPLAPRATAPTAPTAPTPTAATASKSIMEWLDDAVDELHEDARSVWHRAKELVSPSIAEPATPAAAAKPTSALPSKADAEKANVVAHPAVEKITAVAAPAEIAANVALYRSKSPTMQGDTLAIATTRANGDYGVAGTEYTRQYTRDEKKRIAEIDKQLADDVTARKAKQTQGLLSDEDKKKLKKERNAIDHNLATQIGSGNVDQSVFYCSGLSMWTLAASGYNLDAQICGPDDQLPYYAEKKVEGKDPEKVYATLRGVLDGYAADVEIMTLANGRRTGGSVGELKGVGYLASDKLTLAAGGAAGAFVLAGIGEAVDEDKQKPGDFVQSRRSNDKDGNGNAVPRQHRGFGHAWQVSAVTAKGSAWFGVAGRSPTVTGKELTGWQTVPEMIIDASTDPLLVGEHTVIKSRRLEAQDAGVVADQAHDTNKDGGVQITDFKPVGWHPSSYTDYVAFYGRLGTSRWAGFHAATADSARASASGDSAPAEKSAPPATGPGSFDLTDEVAT